MYQSNMPVNQQYFPQHNANQLGGHNYRPRYAPPLFQMSPPVAPSYGVPRMSYQSSGAPAMAQKYDNMYNRAPANYPRIVPNRIVQSNIRLPGNHQEMRHVQNSFASSTNQPGISRLPNQKDQFTNVSTRHKPYYGNFKEPPNKMTQNYSVPMETSAVEQDHNADPPVTTRNFQINNIGTTDGQRRKTYRFDLNEKKNLNETVSNPNMLNNTITSGMNRTMEMVPTAGSSKTDTTTAGKQFIFTGPVEKVIHWNMLLQDRFSLCLYEVIATMVCLQEGTIKTQKIMLVRNIKGPVLQVVYYVFTQIDLDDFHLGMTVRCVGSMIGYNILKAVSIRAATQDEIDHLERMSLISDQAVNFQLTH
uniref:Uncharacterized protein LOC114331638 n=1 Tax=Diabrotica virgifera virgifera TaxID=50390 RepID=A0A6P7FWU3_DIAVI